MRSTRRSLTANSRKPTPAKRASSAATRPRTSAIATKEVRTALGFGDRNDRARSVHGGPLATKQTEQPTNGRAENKQQVRLVNDFVRRDGVRRCSPLAIVG